MSNKVTELNILDETGKSTLFTADTEYVIQLYQRAYAWEDKQLGQLIDDIEGIDKDTARYCIGSLVVSKVDDNKYEVVDGQQRLTSFYMLLNCLNIETAPSLTFACREKSNYTLKNIKSIIDNSGELDMDKIEPNIRNGIDILLQRLNNIDNIDDFKNKLSKVIIYRIELPEHTDLNRYFEIMNTRGEQLEQHNILKATLMGYLKEKVDDMEVFAKIWDACSDMTGYVQMHFVRNDNKVNEGNEGSNDDEKYVFGREAIFGKEWNKLPSDVWENYTYSWQKLKELAKKKPGSQGEEAGSQDEEEPTQDTTDEPVELKIRQIISKDFKAEYDKNKKDKKDSDPGYARFKSIIDFPHFLLHTLKVYIELKGIKQEGGSKIVNEEIDDKKLCDTFNEVVKNGVADGKKIADNQAGFAREFILFLLRTRYLFDQYIIKRDYENSDDGEWSIKSLNTSGQDSKKKANYRHSKFNTTAESSTETDETYLHKKNIMIQSALRVSYTSPKSMHWITELLKWLSESDCKNLSELPHFHEVAENIAKDAVTKNFFDKCKDGVYVMGVSTPTIVFNYLDYLLWKEKPEKYKDDTDFEFKFRDSVEHWYPQHPSDRTFAPWKEDEEDKKDNVNRFGNLCLLGRNDNSRFTNFSPESKKGSWKDIIKTGSIKLRIMSDLTKVPEDKGEDKDEKGGKKKSDDPSYYWKDEACAEHEKEMIKILKEACNIKV